MIVLGVLYYSLAKLLSRDELPAVKYRPPAEA